MQKKTILISVPYPRNIRHSLSKPFINELKKYGNIVVVSPFEFSNEDIDYLDLKNEKIIHMNINETSFSKIFFKISDLARRAGYFSKHKKYGLPYYFNNLISDFNVSGYFEKLPSLYKFILIFLSLVFRKRFIWLSLERLFFNLFNFRSDSLNEIEDLQDVIYFQSANWGMQDRLLSYISYKKSWKSIMIPYTSDQIHCCGYLLIDHNFYAVQSEYERKLAIELHNIEEEKIVVIGSIWHRNIENFIKLNEDRIKHKDKKNILYAGVTSLYFPRITEIKSVKIIAEHFPEYSINYCPYVNNIEFKQMTKKLQLYKNVNLIPHSPSMTEVKTEKAFSFYDDIKAHIEKIMDVDIFVMSYLTSLGTEANYLSSCPLIANFIDEYGILQKRNTDEFPKNMLGENLKIANTYEELINSIEKSINLPNTIKSKQPYEYWDHDISLNKAVSNIMLSLKY